MAKAASKAAPGKPFVKGDPRINRTKPGTGRPPDAMRAKWQQLLSTSQDAIEEAGIAGDVNHGLFPFVVKHANEFGYGKPAQTIQGPDGGPVRLELVNGPDL